MMLRQRAWGKDFMYRVYCIHAHDRDYLREYLTNVSVEFLMTHRVLNFVQGDRDKITRLGIVQYKSLASILQNQLYLFGDIAVTKESVTSIRITFKQQTNLYSILFFLKCYW
jgi:hypothetical protein